MRQIVLDTETTGLEWKKGNRVVEIGCVELMAAIMALEALSEPCRGSLQTDSQYVRQGITEWMANWVRRNWKTAGGDPVKNRDLWERLHAAKQTHKIEWRWVKGHSGDPDNERVDQMAREAAERHRDARQAG